MDDTENVVALQYRIHYNADGVDIVDFIEGTALDIHLAVDAVNALDPAVDLCGHVLRLQAGLNAFDDVLEKSLPVLLAQGQLLFDFVVGHGVKVL